MKIMNRLAGRTGALLGAGLLIAALASCDYIQPTTSDPNAVPSATVDQLFTGIEVNTYFFSEGEPSYLSSIWTQQMTGADRQFAAINQYTYDETTAGDAFNTVYTGGGLVDLKTAIDEATTAGRTTYAGILKVYEAYLIGMTSSLWGDIPYSEAADPNISEPKLDKQADVYAAVQSLLDDAISNLQSGQGAGPGDNDMAFGGDPDRWIAVAHTLKARYNLHWVESEGNSRYQAALTQAQQGIMSADGNWVAVHSSNDALENNWWFQFQKERSGYITAGGELVPMLQNKNDARLGIYFAGPPYSSTSEINTGAGGVAAPGQDFLLVTCAENNFIIAEAQYQLGDPGAAQDAADAAIDCQSNYWGVDLSNQKDRIDAASGDALFQEIMEQKYAAQFLNMDAWNDYKRTCLPALTPTSGSHLPGRLYYSQAERTTNPNIPAPSDQPLRNDNDPNPCS